MHLVRLLIGIFLSVIAFVGLVFVRDAHVTMCMIGALVLAVGLVMPHATAVYLVSIGTGWVLFFTVHTATTFLVAARLFDRLDIVDTTLVGFEGSWLYHTLVNFVLLAVFAMHLDRMRWVVGGYLAALIAAPLMLVLHAYGRPLWTAVESPPLIILYALIGLVLLVSIFSMRYQRTFPRFLQDLRVLAVTSLVFYAAVTLVPYAILLFRVNLPRA
ncbi:MAG: hypothetical protein Q7S96_04870 [bacterium]|nr:hypothetical protein [bacterium]